MEIKSVHIKFDKLKGETAKAVLLSIRGTQHWFPKKLCWDLVINKKLGGNCVIPAWLYEKIFNEAPDEADAVETVEKHVPVRIDPKAIEPDESLIR